MIIKFILHVNNLEKIILVSLFMKIIKLIRFRNFHIVHNSEGFFKNILLQTIPFCDEKNLLSENNFEFSCVKMSMKRNFTT